MLCGFAVPKVWVFALQEDPCLRVGMSVTESERYPVLGVGPLDILGAYAYISMICIHLAVAGHHLMLVLYGRLTFQPACVFRGLNKGLTCMYVCMLRLACLSQAKPSVDWHPPLTLGHQ